MQFHERKKLTSPIVTASAVAKKESVGVGFTATITGWPAMYSIPTAAPASIIFNDTNHQTRLKTSGTGNDKFNSQGPHTLSQLSKMDITLAHAINVLNVFNIVALHKSEN